MVFDENELALYSLSTPKRTTTDVATFELAESAIKTVHTSTFEDLLHIHYIHGVTLVYIAHTFIFIYTISRNRRDRRK